MQVLTIFYDAHCGLCGGFRRWMQTQASTVRLEFIPYDSAEALRRLPELAKMRPDREIVVMSDRGAVWQGAGAWVVCLWVLRDWRAWARRLASPVLLPVAGNVCQLISQNRIGLSRLLALRSDADLRDRAARQGVSCGDGGCGITRGVRLGGAMEGSPS